jgi:hypothetical protein
MRFTMKPWFPGFLLFAAVSAASAQVVIPPMPGKTDTRPIGGGSSPGVEVIPKENPKVRYTTHIVLSVSRMWTSTDGKLLEGKLIAFEDLVAEAPKGAPPPPAPEAPKHPTVVKGDKIRLLIHKKPVEVALARLSQGDREFVEQTRKSYEAKTPPTP